MLLQSGAVFSEVTVSNKSSYNRLDGDYHLNGPPRSPLGKESVWLPTETTNLTFECSTLKQSVSPGGENTQDLNKKAKKKKPLTIPCMSASGSGIFLSHSPRAPGPPPQWWRLACMGGGGGLPGKDNRDL